MKEVKKRKAAGGGLCQEWLVPLSHVLVTFTQGALTAGFQHTNTDAGSATHWHVPEAQQHPCRGLYQPSMLLSMPGPKHGCRNAHGIVHLPINRRFARASSALATAEDEREGMLATKWDKAETGLLRGLSLFNAGRRRRCSIRGRSESHRTLGVWCQGTCRGPQGRQEQRPQYCFSITHLQQVGEISAAVGCYFPGPRVWRPEGVFHPKRDEYLVLGGVAREQKPICSLSSPSLCLAPNKVRERLRNPFLKGSTPATC